MSYITTLPDKFETAGTEACRAARYGQVMLGYEFDAGDKVRVVRLKKVSPEVFAATDLSASEDTVYGEFVRNPDVIAMRVQDTLPHGFGVLE